MPRSRRRPRRPSSPPPRRLPARPARDPEAPRIRYRTSAWLGVYLQPVAVLAVLVAFGMLRDPWPDDETPILVALGVVALAGLVPLVVDVVRQHRALAAADARYAARTGRRPTRLGWRLTGFVFGWSMAHAAICLVPMLVAKAVAGERWSQEATFSALVGLMIATAFLLVGVLAFGVVSLGIAVRAALDRRAGDTPFALAFGGVGLVFVGLVLAVPMLGTLPDDAPHGRGLGTVVGAVVWAGAGDGAMPWVLLGRVGAVLMLVGFGVAVAATVAFWWGELASLRARRVPDDDRPGPGTPDAAES